MILEGDYFTRRSSASSASFLVQGIPIKFAKNANPFTIHRGVDCRVLCHAIHISCPSGLNTRNVHICMKDKSARRSIKNYANSLNILSCSNGI